MRDLILQTSRLTLQLVHMHRILWLKLLASFPFHGERLFGEDLEKYIQKISSGKTTLLAEKKKNKRPCFKRSLSPAPGKSTSSQWRRHFQPATKAKEDELQRNKKQWGSTANEQSPKTSA